jgi:hypothetical protein
VQLDTVQQFFPSSRLPATTVVQLGEVNCCNQAFTLIAPGQEGF